MVEAFLTGEGEKLSQELKLKEGGMPIALSPRVSEEKSLSTHNLRGGRGRGEREKP